MAGRRARVFIVESDSTLQHSLACSLTGAGYDVATEPQDGAIDFAAARFSPDLAIVDVPGCAHGFVVVQRLRSAVAVPILFLTDFRHDHGEERPATQDDCLCKPFSSVEALSSVRRLLCRAGYLEDGAVRVIGDLTLDDATRTVSRASHVIELTRKEYELLSMLARHPGQILTHAQLSSYVWGSHDYGKNLIEVHVSALRRKLEAHGPRLIHTVRNLGYVLKPC